MTISLYLVIGFDIWMHILNIPRNKRLPLQQNLIFLLKMEFLSILVARQQTLHVLYLLPITLLQNIAYTLFDTIGEIKGLLLYCFRFEMILNLWLLSQKCHQHECTSLWDGLWLPSNSTLKMIRRKLLYVKKPESSFYMCIRIQPKLPTQ